ncbi:MAG: T9SS type A sorting domain-containing protein [Saprospiraceae bacterium]
MKKMFLFLLVATATLRLAAQNIYVLKDSLHKVVPVSQNEIEMKTYLVNNSGSEVTIKWTRTLEQLPTGWTTNFCDNNACYLGTVSTKQFNLMNGDSGLLKPLFYPNGVAGTIVYRVALESVTPGITYTGSVVYVAVAEQSTGTAAVELVKDLAVFPNPTSEVLNVVFADANFSGTLQISDSGGRILLTQTNASATSTVNIAALPAGFYTLTAISKEGSVSKGFVKN